MSTSNNSSPNSEASLLGVPAELRLQIYEQVFAADLKYTTPTEWTWAPAGRGFKRAPEADKNDRLIIPWLNLMLTCKDIAKELRGTMKEKAFRSNKRNRTYVLDLIAKRRGSELNPPTWRQLPCAPRQARYVEARFNSSNGFRYGGDGGIAHIVRDFWQTLNHIIHCGPRFDSDRPLRQSMHIKELRISVENPDITPEEIEKCRRSLNRRMRGDSPEVAVDTLHGMIGHIVGTGVLRGVVDKIELESADKVFNWKPAKTKGDGIPDYWKVHSFFWGMDEPLR